MQSRLEFMDYQKVNKLISKTASLTPFIFLLFIAAFFLFVGVKQGHFPTYGNPDPKSYPILLSIAQIFMLVVPVSFVLWLLILLKSILTKTWKVMQQDFWIGILGFLLVLIVINIDPMGILNWLTD